MFKSFRPEPMSPNRAFNKNKLLTPDNLNNVTASPSKTLNADLFLSANAAGDIANMKIFDENNDEGMPQNWTDKLKHFRNHNPSIYDSLHSATLRPEMYSPEQTQFFNKRNKARLFSATHKRNSNGSNQGESSHTRLPGKVSIRIASFLMFFDNLFLNDFY